MSQKTRLNRLEARPGWLSQNSISAAQLTPAERRALRAAGLTPADVMRAEKIDLSRLSNAQIAALEAALDAQG